jgi:hypothetical protein
MTARTKSTTALAALMAAITLGVAAPALADPVSEARARVLAEAERAGNAPQSQNWRDDNRREEGRRDDWRRDDWGRDQGRRDDWRDNRPDYRNPNAFVNVTFRERFERIESRIHRGIEDGSLTRREARFLWRQLDDTRALAMSYRRSQGAYTVWEADEIDARLDRIRRDVRGQRRDDQWSSWRNDDWRSRSASGF